MKISTNGVNLLIVNEGKKYKMYKCPNGYPTIGIGHLIKSNEQHLMTAVLSEQQVMDLFRKDIAHAENWINTNCKWKPTQNQFDVLCSFLHQYNIDSGKYPNTRKAFVNGDIAAIKRILENDFNHAVVANRDGLLKNRRKRELALFNAV